MKHIALDALHFFHVDDIGFMNLQEAMRGEIGNEVAQRATSDDSSAIRDYLDIILDSFEIENVGKTDLVEFLVGFHKEKIPFFRMRRKVGEIASLGHCL